MDDLQGKKEELLKRLARFLEVHTGSRVAEATSGGVRMILLHAKNTKKTKPVEKLINYKLSRLEEFLLAENRPFGLREYHISDFLVEELEKTVRSRL